MDRGQRFGGTIADTINPESDLPDFLQFECDPSKSAEAMYEAYDNSSVHLRFDEARTGIGTQVGKYCAGIDDIEEWNAEDFIESEYNTGDWELQRVKGYIRWFHNHPTEVDKYRKDEETKDSNEEVDDRPQFDPTAEGADPMLVRLMKKKADVADDKVASVKETCDEKYYAIFDCARRIANGRALKKHAFICGDAGVGKSYSVEKALDKGLQEFKPNSRNPQAPTLFKNYGSIGTSMSNILIFFYEHREHELLLLDDADGFLTMKDQDVQNFLKAVLDPSSHPVTTSVTARAYANNLLKRQWVSTQNATIGESSEISVDLSRLPEGKASCKINGNDISWEVKSFDEAKKLSAAFAPKTLRESWLKKAKGLEKNAYEKANPNSSYFKKHKFFEADMFDDEDDGLTEEERRILQGLGSPSDDMLADECPQIPSSWQFKSSLILISNLRMSDINDAVKSRCQCVELTLTRPEFLCRAEEIFDKLDVGASETSNSPETVEWAKRESFAVFKSIVGATEMKGTGFDDIKINIPLEFRLIAAMTGAWLARYDRWCQIKGIDNADNKEYFAEAEEDLLLPFIKYDLKPLLAGDTRLKKRK